MNTISRRTMLKLTGTAGLMGILGVATWPTESIAAAKGKVVVIGGGFGGTTCARYLKRWGPQLDVTLIEKKQEFITCPFLNEVLVGDIEFSRLTFNYNNVTAAGIKVVHNQVKQIDTEKKRVDYIDGKSIYYDKLIVSPGVSFTWGGIENDKAATESSMPHAYQPGDQVLQLRKQLHAMRDGGTMLIIPPKKPFRCPPGPYERASLCAHYFKWHKPKSKVIILDQNSSHSKQAAFHEGWKLEYGDMIEWINETDGGNIDRVEPDQMMAVNLFGDEFKGDVINLIPNMTAGELAIRAGLVNNDNWCNVDATTFESEKAKDVHVIGDACVAGAMPKSAHAAGSQARVCAAAIVSDLAATKMPEPSYANTCYSLITPEYGISVANVYKNVNGVITVASGGPSPTGQSLAIHRKEARYVHGWYHSITDTMFGAYDLG